MAYNKGGVVSLTGNWVEEKALAAVTGVSRYTPWVDDAACEGTRRITKAVGVGKSDVDTTSRVVAHSDAVSPSQYASVTAAAVAESAAASGAHRVTTVGPRARRRAAELAASAVEADLSEARAALDATAAATRAAAMTTSVREAYVVYGGDAYDGSGIGRRVMRSIDGKPLPLGSRDVEFLAANGLMRRTAALGRGEVEGVTASAGDTPVTIYSQRLVEGVFPGSGSASTSAAGAGGRGGNNPFARSSEFTADVRDPTARHAGAVDGAEGETVRERVSTVVGAGGELGTTEVLSRVRKALLDACGELGIASLRRLLRRMDSNGDGRVDVDEFRTALCELGATLSARDMVTVMSAFDRDGSGRVSAEELLVGLHGELPAARAVLAEEAFRRLDKSGDGRVTVGDLAASYDASRHPRVIDGSKSSDEVMSELLTTWDVTSKDGVVTKEEFLEYYACLSAEIARDDTWELMMRNVWHISGGTGAAANTSCRRVLVIHNDATQEVVEVTDDLGLNAGDIPAIKAKLRKQGVKNIHSVKLAE